MNMLDFCTHLQWQSESFSFSQEQFFPDPPLTFDRGTLYEDELVGATAKVTKQCSCDAVYVGVCMYMCV